MRKIAICDGSREVLTELQRMLTCQYMDEFQISIYTSGNELLRAWQKDERKKTDIIVIDVRAEDNGLEVGRQVQELFGDVKIIYITDSLEYLEEIFEAEPVYMLGKPIRREKLYEGVDRAIGQITEKEDMSVTLMSKSFVARVRADEISYVESERRVLTVHTSDEDIKVNMKLCDLENRLPDYFVRVHQSYLVNMKQIRLFSAKGVELMNGRSIPVSRPRYANAKEIFMDFLKVKEE